MGWVTGSAVYFVIWWLTLFIVLPFGVRRREDDGWGHDSGAPQRSRILMKMLINTGLATVIFAIVFTIDFYDLVSFDDFRAPATGRGGTF